jgi:hypothetical protein
MLTRYWVTFDPSDAKTITSLSLGLGVGVTAFDSSDAKKLIFAAFADFADFVLPEIINITEHITYDDLEANHVKKNMGSMAVRGVWYPKQSV